MAGVKQQHATAILDLLEADPNLVVYDGKVPDKPNPVAAQYVLVYLTTTTAKVSSQKGMQDWSTTRAYCHCVGADATAARAISGRVANLLLNVTPTITGRVCWPIRDDDSGSPPDRDETTGVLVMDQVDVYRLESVPS